MPGVPGDSSVGGPQAFPSTIWPVLDSLKRRENPQAALDQLVARYWKPVYAWIRAQWRLPHEDAKDRTQGFFLFLMEGDALLQADPARGRFRSFLKTILRNYLGMEHRKETRQRRGGDVDHLSLNLPEGDVPVAAPENADPERLFDREWARSLVSETLADVERSLASAGRESHWRILAAHDLADGEPPTYAGLAAAHGVTEHQVKAILQETRRRIRDGVIQKIREYALDDREIWEELEYLMGLWRGA